MLSVGGVFANLFRTLYCWIRSNLHILSHLTGVPLYLYARSLRTPIHSELAHGAAAHRFELEAMDAGPSIINGNRDQAHHGSRFQLLPPQVGDFLIFARITSGDTTLRRLEPQKNSCRCNALLR